MISVPKLFELHQTAATSEDAAQGQVRAFPQARSGV
jgi:hypothetical protein